MNSYPKRLIEVDLPIKQISAHARREKSIRHGHISTLHIWWARRPLAACRAVICAALWPDPVDELCPQRFRDEAANIINNFATKAATDKELSKHCSTVNWNKWQVLAKPENRLDGTNSNHLNILRYRLLDFIADFANWDNSTQPDYLETSRLLTQIAHESLGGIPGTKPLVVDPFAGGGAIPLEALRVGADAFASDLNPVAVLLNKVVLEYIPKYGQTLADEVRKWGEWVKNEAEKELAEFYPKDADGSTPIAYLWARTITCEGPGCGAEVPLMRSFWLAKKSNRSVALQLIPNPKQKRVDFEIIEKVNKKWVSADNHQIEVKNPNFDGTVKRGSGTCPCCGFTTPVASVRKQLKARHGGGNDARLFCVVVTKENQKGRFYRLPNPIDLEAIEKAKVELEKRKKQHQGELSLVPDEPTPDNKGHRAVGSVWLYGMQKWEDLFIFRQALALTTLVKLVRDVGEKLTDSEDEGLAIAVQTILGLGVSRFSDICNSLCMWENTKTQVRHAFTRQAIPMMWDFAEPNVFADAAGNYYITLTTMLNFIKNNSVIFTRGQAEQSSATTHPLPDDFAQCFCSDPPYYDAVPYAELSDFFYVWLKRTLPSLGGISFADKLTPKKEQAIVWHPNSAEEKLEFEKKMGSAMAEGWRILSPDGIGVIVFAHKSTAGWEAQLQAMVNAGWTMTGSWPIDTEMGTRMNAMGTASLASSVHLVCRPRNTEEIGDWRDVLQELPQRIHEWMPRLASEGVVGADAIFACLGPALEIFSRYSSVEKASGEIVTLREYLEYVWAAVSKEALGMIFSNADATGFEEDARLTAMWLWTLSADATNSEPSDADNSEDDDEDSPKKSTQISGYILEFDAARKIAQGLGAHLENLDRLVEIKGQKARLLPVAERSAYLLGKDAGKAPTSKRKSKSQPQQLSLFPTLETEEEAAEWGKTAVETPGKTVLDRIHQTMILFAAGRSEAMKRFLVDEGIGNDQRFWTLAQALSALYPSSSEEKRWVDGVLARKKNLGF